MYARTLMNNKEGTINLSEYKNNDKKKIKSTS